MIEIKRRERDAILQSLQAGLVPRLGLHLIQVGRKQEVEAMLADLERIGQGGATFRIVVGRFGSGKSFFMNLVRNLALQKRMVVVQADMSMERRLQASGGEARALYSELVKNLAIKNKPDGGALRNLCEGWISTLQYEVTQSGGTQEDVKKRIFEDLKTLQDHVGGFEFTEVLAKYTKVTFRETMPCKVPRSAGCAPSTQPKPKRAKTSASAASSMMRISTTALNCWRLSASRLGMPASWSTLTKWLCYPTGCPALARARPTMNPCSPS